VKVGETLRASFPNLGIIGFAENWQHEAVVKLPNGSLRVIPTNLALEEFRQIVLELFEAAQGPKPENVIVFLPSKAGSGASSTALNVTGALARKCGKSTILIEADLHSGPAGMYLGLNPVRSILDALEMSDRLEKNWNEMVIRAGDFDILPACSIRGRVPQVSTWAYKRLLFHVGRRYDYAVFDLPEVVNDATETIVTSAKAVYVVCTPEVPSLVLARKRCSTLIDRGVASDRLHIVLNRYSKDGPDATAITEIVGYPIGQVIPNDYKSLWEANLRRRLVDHKSPAGSAYEAFARTLTGKPALHGKSARKLFGLFPAA
jgi:pilus assembly protein CpaE